MREGSEKRTPQMMVFLVRESTQKQCPKFIGITDPMFNSKFAPIQKWWLEVGRLLSYWGPVTFQGRSVKNFGGWCIFPIPFP